jgi:hypothetical protein
MDALQQQLLPTAIGTMAIVYSCVKGLMRGATHRKKLDGFEHP